MIKIVVKGMQYIYGLNPQQKAEIKDSLMFSNPAYISAVKYSKYPVTKIPKFLSFYEDLKDCLAVPLGYKLDLNLIDGIQPLYVNEQVKVKVEYPEFKFKLRELQEKAKIKYLEDTTKGLVSMPTGSGKTTLGLNLAHTLKQKTLIIVHKEDLVVGWKKDILSIFGKEVKSGLIKAKSRKIGDEITIATVQTLSKLTEEEIEKYQDTFGLIIVDECLVADSMILKEDGGFCFIKDVKNKDKLVGGEVSNCFSKKSKIWRVESKHSVIEGSPTHPTFVLSKAKLNTHKKYTEEDLEVKCLKDIEVGDRIPIVKKIPHTTKNSWSEDQLAFVALIQTVGHLDIRANRVKVNVANDQLYYRLAFETGVKSFGDFEVKRNLDCRGNLTMWCNSKELKDILEFTFDIPRGKKSHTIVINDEIQYAPLESIKAYIGSLFSCGGDLSISKGYSFRINIGLCSKYFIYGLSYLLKKFGIMTNYQEIDRSAKHDKIFRLGIGGSNFNTLIDSLGYYIANKKIKGLRNVGTKSFIDTDHYSLVPVKQSYLTTRKEEVFDYTTTSHKFIVNGALTHNCHHIGSKTYNIVTRFNAQYKLGLSATPERNDGLMHVFKLILGDFSFKFIEGVHKNEAVLPAKVIVKTISDLRYKPKYIRVGTCYRLATKIEEVSKKLDIAEIEEVPYQLRPKVSHHFIDDLVVTDRKFYSSVLDTIKKEHENGRNMIIFLSQRKHCDFYADLLVLKGFKESDIQIYYGDTKSETEAILENAESGKVRITLATMKKATEGTNVVAWDVAFLLSSLNNGMGVEQSIGRIRRAKEGKINPVLVYDYYFPNVFTIKGHIITRLARYNELKFEVQHSTKNENEGMFSKGFKD